jgi:hypothetical protein
MHFISGLQLTSDTDNSHVKNNYFHLMQKEEFLC